MGYSVKVSLRFAAIVALVLTLEGGLEGAASPNTLGLRVSAGRTPT